MPRWWKAMWRGSVPVGLLLSITLAAPVVADDVADPGDEAPSWTTEISFVVPAGLTYAVELDHEARTLTPVITGVTPGGANVAACTEAGFYEWLNSDPTLCGTHEVHAWPVLSSILVCAEDASDVCLVDILRLDEPGYARIQCTTEGVGVQSWGGTGHHEASCKAYHNYAESPAAYQRWVGRCSTAAACLHTDAAGLPAV